MSQLIFCQNIYPKAEVIKNDTVVLLRLNQVQQINGFLVERDFLKKELILLEKGLSYKDSLIVLKDLQIKNYNFIVEDYKKSLEATSKVTTEQEKIIREKNKEIIKKSFLYGGGGLILGAFIGFLVR